MKNNMYDWDLDSILEGDTLNVLHKKWKNIIKKILKFYPEFYKSYSSFKEWLYLNEEYECIDNKLENYISNNRNIDLKNSNWIEWENKIAFEKKKFHEGISDFCNLVIEHKNKINEFLKNSELKKYKREFYLIFRYENHILEKNVEKKMTKFSGIGGGFHEIFNTLTNVDIKYSSAIDSKGKSHVINNQSDVILLLKSNDRKLRKSAWINYNIEFDKLQNTLITSLFFNYKVLNSWAAIRNFKNYIHRAAFSDEIDVSFIINLYKKIEKYKGAFVSYKKIRNKYLKRKLNVKKIEPWDKRLELSKNEIYFSIEEAKKIIIEALSPLGEEYQKVIKKCFNEKWISWLPKKDKISGAYSIGGIKGLNKYYILMNYDKTFNSILTAAHEIGHSINSYFIAKNQKIYCDTSIFYAEIPSITNEILLILFLLKKYKNNKDLKIMLFDNILSTFFSSTIVQIVFSNFEFIISEWENEGKSFTIEKLKAVYLELLQKYEGIKEKNNFSKKPYSYSFSRIPISVPHFYAGNFYVYKYAIGQIVAIYAAFNIFEKNNDMIGKYYKFLGSGSSRSPINTIKLLGIDLYQPYIYEYVFKKVNKLISDFSQIM